MKMKKAYASILLSPLLWLLPLWVTANDLPYAGKRVLYVNSYHHGYAWSDGITDGIKNVLKNSGVEMEIFHMDTKRNSSSGYSKAAARRALKVIESFNPDVVITSDDSAARYLIEPYYRDAPLPFVFCGINWDAGVYGFPYSNVTGMQEVALVKPLVSQLQQYTKGKRIGYLAKNDASEEAYQQQFSKVLGHDFEKIWLVDSVAEWKARFIELQDDVDIIIQENMYGIDNWDDAAAAEFVESHARIPIGTSSLWMKNQALLAYGKVPEEQGIWAAETALKILDGTPPSQIPMTYNHEAHVVINLRVGNKLGIVFKPSLLKLAEILR